MAGDTTCRSEQTLGELGEFRNGANFSQDDYGPGYPIVNVKQLYRGRYASMDDLHELSAAAVSNAESLFLRYGDILFARSSVKASGAGQAAMVGPCRRNAVFSGFIIRFRVAATDRVAPEFLNYLLRSPIYRELLTRIGSGTTITNLSQDTLAGLPIELPPLAEQKAIAAVLGALDDKIELNRRMNATLEAMARALFQSWFIDFDPVRENLDRNQPSTRPVGHPSPTGRRDGDEGASGMDFDPVRAKLDGRQPAALDPATVALFPERLEDSPLGHIPKGWTAQRLPDAIEVNPRRTLKSGTIAPYLDMKNLPTQGHSAEEVIDREFSSGTKFQNGDTLLARITPCLENGKTGYVDFLEDGQVGWGSTEYIVLATKPPLPPQFGYLLARSDALRTHAIQNMTGTSGRQRVPSECFHNFWLAVPPPEIAHRFDELTAPLMAKIKANSTESRTLATLRDTLLPKLLSGELSVAAATCKPDLQVPPGAKKP